MFSAIQQVVSSVFSLNASVPAKKSAPAMTKEQVEKFKKCREDEIKNIDERIAELRKMLAGEREIQAVEARKLKVDTACKRAATVSETARKALAQPPAKKQRAPQSNQAKKTSKTGSQAANALKAKGPLAELPKFSPVLPKMSDAIYQVKTQEPVLFPLAER